MNELKILVNNKSYMKAAEKVCELVVGEIVLSEASINEEDLVLVYDEIISLQSGKLSLYGDFSKLLPRIKSGVVNSEMLVKAARIKGIHEGLTAFDATAGMGEDSILLAAAGFDVTMYEYNPVIVELLKDAINRASKLEGVSMIAERMHVSSGDSISYMRELSENNKSFDVIYLDPMFPERNKSAMIGKKFQLLQRLERPCANESELLQAAMDLKPRKLVIKRPVKGVELAGIKPDYVIAGKAVRYDCFTYAR